MTGGVEKVFENPDRVSIFSNNNESNVQISEPFDSIIDLVSYFQPAEEQSPPRALLILNQKINLFKSTFLKLWNSSTFRICADGGLNRLREFDSSLIPDFVIGDLDSVTKENLEFYKSKGTKVILQSSQYYTDFNKSISLINSYFNIPSLFSNLDSLNTIDELELKEEELSKDHSNFKEVNIILIGGVGGRFDQSISIIHQIFKLSISKPYLNLIILNPEHFEFIFMLSGGANLIKFPRFSSAEELNLFGINYAKSRPNLRNVGILPLIENSVVSTIGLKWDVENWNTCLRSKVSSSNLQVGDEGFIIKTSNSIFMNIEL